jgi:hypothetical protein
VVVSFVAEAEIAGVFTASHIALDKREIMVDLGYSDRPPLSTAITSARLGSPIGP